MKTSYSVVGFWEFVYSEFIAVVVFRIINYFYFHIYNITSIFKKI